MTPEQANAVYDILIAHAGATEHDREDFVDHQTGTNPPTEYRFQGSLGFGGKFWREGWDRRWYVTAYREHLTTGRQAAIDKTNAALKALQEQGVKT